MFNHGSMNEGLVGGCCANDALYVRSQFDKAFTYWEVECPWEKPCWHCVLRLMDFANEREASCGGMGQQSGNQCVDCFIESTCAQVVYVLNCTTLQEVQVCIIFFQWVEVAQWGNVLFEYMFFGSFPCICISKFEVGPFQMDVLSGQLFATFGM